MLLPVSALILAGRRRRAALYPAFYPVALPAGAGAQGQQVLGRSAGLGAAAATSSSSPSSRSRSGSSSAPPSIYAQTVYARTVDPGYRRDHILQVDELSRYQLDRQRRGDRRARCARVPGVDRGRPHRHRRRRPTTTTIPACIVPGKPSRSRSASIGRRGFLRRDGHAPARRPLVRRQPADGRHRRLPFPPTTRAEQALRGARRQHRHQRARREADGLQRPGGRGRQDRPAPTSSSDEYGLVPATIIGVVGDSRFRSVSEPLDPIMFRERRHRATARCSSASTAIRRRCAPGRAGLEAASPTTCRSTPSSARTSSSELYKAEDARAKIFAAFALLAVIVGCLGLFGLAAFTAERRTKEIGIRKVLGARVRDIVRLLVWQFSKPVIVANLIAWPVAWWVMRDWLNGFDARIALGPSPFLLAGGLALAHRHRHHRRPRLPGRAREPDPRLALRIGSRRLGRVARASGALGRGGSMRNDDPKS